METQELALRLPEEESKGLVFSDTIKSEVNFLIFPFFALSTKGLRTRLETEYLQAIKRGDERLEILWNVSANPKYGYPGPFDREVHKAIEQIISEILQRDGKIANPIPLGSLYQLCRRMGMDSFGGSQYRKIKGALDALSTDLLETFVNPDVRICPF